MTEHDIPKGISLDTLLDVLKGWGAVGAAVEPQYTAEVEDETGIADAVGRQTRFLEELGVLEPVGQKHRLTDTGGEIARALGDGDEAEASERLREVLVDWPATEEVRGLVRDNPLPEEELVPLVAAATGQDPESGRVRSGVTTLLDLLAWTDLLARDEEGRYRLPETGKEPTEETKGVGVAVEPGEESAEAEVTPEDVASLESTLSELDDAVQELQAAEAARSAGGEEAEAEGDGTEEAEGEDTEEVAVTAGDLAAVESALTELADVAEELQTAEATVEEAATTAREAREAAETVQAGKSEQHAVSLDLDINPEDLEAIVAGIRRGLQQEGNDEE